MTALNFQIAFAQILTDSSLRNKVFGGKTANLEQFDLDESQLNNLLLLDGNSVGEYSRLLSATRLSMVMNVLPFTKKLLPEDFIAKIADDYEMKEPPVMVNGSPTIEEVKRFERYLKNSPEIFKSAHPFLSDICRYEINCFLLKNESSLTNFTNDDGKPFFENEKEFLISTLKLDERIKIMHFEYDITEIISSLRLGKIQENIEKKRVNLIFQPLPSTIRVKSVSETVCSLLKLCDGSFTVEEICNRFIEQISNANINIEVLRKQIIKILRELSESQILISG